MSERSHKIILALSLALNLFAIGAAAGGAYIWYADSRPKIAAGQGLHFAAEGLSAVQRKAFRQMLTQARRDSAADIDAARTGRGEVARLLEQDPLDQAAIDAELSTIRAADMALRSRLEQAVIAFAGILTPAERQTLVDGLRGRSAMLRQIAPRKN